MDNKQSRGVCESCGMPMDANTVSKYDPRYCIYCQDQETRRLKTYEEVKQGSIGAAQKFMGKTEEEAIKMTEEMLPKLSRWKLSL
ncbi:MAG: hypothetical protein UT63_C0023G0005 [Candidatus Gottesmanbacteria bacterium GW2011_GWC2_39_8]|uniref:Putative zinc ribbon domain-containing protein n=1 Tax=Candidatus Gottesmanbacteria bacterium GW2011_GWC2_39_8 TaxID=1618450 RepID=A0A0G0T5Q4_9BACT|nr:MAG: hypothetical protein UT63_C0023G0005 [Candidatus Gottesmanbacteria bacterium GW2011_GWC2_39_8]